MKTWIAAGAALALMAGGIAMAQTPPPPAPPGPPPGEAGPQGGFMGRGPDRGPEGMRHGGMERMMRMRAEFSQAAHFRFRRDGAMVDIKCAADEPTKACVDAASALLDKLGAQPK